MTALWKHPPDGPAQYYCGACAEDPNVADCVDEMTGEVPPGTKCGKCGRNLSVDSTMEIRIETNNAVTRFPCSLCDGSTDKARFMFVLVPKTAPVDAHRISNGFVCESCCLAHSPAIYEARELLFRLEEIPSEEIIRAYNSLPENAVVESCPF